MRDTYLFTPSMRVHLQLSEADHANIEALSRVSHFHSLEIDVFDLESKNTYWVRRLEDSSEWRVVQDANGGLK